MLIQHKWQQVAHGEPEDEISAIGVVVLRAIYEGVSVNSPKVTYVNITGASSFRVIKLANIRIPMVTLKTGRNYEFQGGDMIDRDTGLRCSALGMEVINMSAHSAEVFVVSQSGTTSISHSIYKLVKTESGWIVTKVIRALTT